MALVLCCDHLCGRTINESWLVNRKNPVIDDYYADLHVGLVWMHAYLDTLSYRSICNPFIKLISCNGKKTRKGACYNWFI